MLDVKPRTFDAMLYEREAAKKKRGHPSNLCLEQQLLPTLEFWREYRTQHHLAVDWPWQRTPCLAPSSGSKIRSLRAGELPCQPAQRAAVRAGVGVVIVDVTEHPADRPKKAAPVLLR